MPFAFHTVPASDAPNGPKLLKSKPVRAAHARVAHDRTVRCGEGVQPTKTRGAARREKEGRNVGVPPGTSRGLGVSASVRIDFVVRYDGLRASAQQKNQEEHGRWHSQQPQNGGANRAVSSRSRSDSQLVPHRMPCGKPKQTECRGCAMVTPEERCGTRDPGCVNRR